ncbi:IS3 family transposase, partial [Fructilactobacillus sanfranciscensis]|uniref:IS3 family transposase n=1 Tax=Fructilactobacillus sanfranciscensis TaxID=1625 RepID=UPI0013D51AD1
FDDQTYKILSQKVSKHMTSKLVSHTLIEALHSILKREFAFQTRFTSFEDVVLKTENYIHWYNTERIRITV